MAEINGYALTTALERIATKSALFDAALRVLGDWLATFTITIFQLDGYWIVTLSADLQERVQFPSFSLALDYALKAVQKRMQP
ncbi:MAG: hypothetical protein LC130_23150 [Bryobacterales bacterium]|nr:hypothetical protein [Bryobacterales bacterium]